MRVIALEEHFATPGIAKAIGLTGALLEQLQDLETGRLAAMDAGGIDVQVLSHAQPGAEALAAADALPLAKEANDILAAAIARHRDRLSGFAVLPSAAPSEAADELERAVRRLGLKGALINGRVGGRFLDDAFFWPIFECAEHLQVPIYLHPAVPPQIVREACYEGLPPAVSQWLARAAWGWHMDTGIHALRLILSGVFDRFPKLTVVIGHMGEAVPFMLDRTNRRLPEEVTGLQREVKEYFAENFYVTTSSFFSYPPLLCLLLVLGADRVMFAVDYPYSSNEEGRAFLDSLPLSPTDSEKIAHLNAERLLGLSPG